MEDVHCAAFIITSLRSLSAPYLSSLGIDSPISFAALTPGQNNTGLPFDLFDKELRLSHLTMRTEAWKCVDCVRHLTHLNLSGVRATVAHNMSDLIATFQSATRLKQLVMRSMIISTSGVIKREILLPKLERLDVGFDSTAGTGLLIGNFIMPLLSTLSVTLEEGGIEGFKCCCSDRDIFRDVTSLYIRSTSPATDPRTFPHTLFKCLDAVTSLNLYTAHKSVMQGLVAATTTAINMKSPSSMLLPRLKILGVRGEMVVLIKEFVGLRAEYYGRHLDRLEIQFRDREQELSLGEHADWRHIALNVRIRASHRPEKISRAQFRNTEL